MSNVTGFNCYGTVDFTGYLRIPQGTAYSTDEKTESNTRLSKGQFAIIRPEFALSWRQHSTADYTNSLASASASSQRLNIPNHLSH